MKGIKAAFSRNYEFTNQENIVVLHKRGKFQFLVAGKLYTIEQRYNQNTLFCLKQRDQILMQAILPKLIYRKGKILPESPIEVYYGSHIGYMIKGKKGYALFLDGKLKGQLSPYCFFHRDEIWFDSSIIMEEATALCIILKLVQANFELPLI